VRSLYAHCVNTVMHNNTYKLRFNFTTVTNQQAIDALVHALTIDLFINNGVECTQPCADLLEFTSSKDCTFAQLALADDSRYTVQRL